MIKSCLLITVVNVTQHSSNATSSHISTYKHPSTSYVVGTL